MARALKGVAVNDLFPTVGANASATKALRSNNAQTAPNVVLDTDTYQAGFDATWEIDIFGGKRRALEAARSDLQAVEEDRRGVLVSLMAEVARNYIEYRGVQRRLEITRQNIRSQQEVFDITQLRCNSGLASELDVAQAKALLASTQAQLPTLEVSLKQFSNRLCVLLATTPGSLGSSD